MAVGVALAIGSLLFTVWQVLDVLLLLFVGLLMGLFLSTLADWLHQHARLPRGVALALVVLTLFGAIVLAVWLSGPALAEQADQLREQIPSAVDRLRERVARYDIGQQLLDDLPDPGKLFSDRGAFLTRATGIVSGALGALGTLFVIVLFGIFIGIATWAVLRFLGVPVAACVVLVHRLYVDDVLGSGDASAGGSATG